MAKIRKFKLDESELKSSVAKIGESAKKERESDTASMMSDLSKKPEKKAAPAASAAKPKSQSFGSAFAAARKAGSKTFMWNGKSFTTQVAGEKKSAPPAPTTKTPPPAATAQRKPPAMVKSGLPSTQKPAVDGRAALNRIMNAKIVSPKARVMQSGSTAVQQRKIAEAKDRAAGYQKKAAANIARDDSMSELDKVRAKFRERGQTPTFAKGGSIDGIAKRGKTRARRK